MFYLHLSNRVKSNQRNNEQQKKIYSNNLTEEIFCLAFIYNALLKLVPCHLCTDVCFCCSPAQVTGEEQILI